MGFLIENAATRASLKSAFDHLFCKYGRDFSDDDEIDLTDLSIVKAGKHVQREQPREFGDCYMKPTLQEELYRRMRLEELEEFVDPLEQDQEDNYDDVFVRLSGKVKAAQIKSFARAAIPFTPPAPLPPLPEVPRRKRGRPRKERPGESSPAVQVPKEPVIPQAAEVPIQARFDACLLSMIHKEDAAAPLALYSLPTVCKCLGAGCFDCRLISICVNNIK